MVERETAKTEILRYFKCNYDYVELNGQGTLPVCRLDLHVSNQKYFLFKENVIWEANCHEYLYLFDIEHLTAKAYKEIEEYVLKEGMKLIKPQKNHMYSYLSMVIVSDKSDKEAIKMLKSCKIRKDFKFSLHGWMEVHNALYSCSDGIITTNSGGREFTKLLKNI